MLHLRLIIPDDLVEVVLDELNATPGVTHIVRGVGHAEKPSGELVICDVAREVTNDLVEWLQDQGVDHRGSIAVEAPGTIVSDAAQVAEREAPGHGGDALVWEQLEATARNESTLTWSYLTFISIAATIAAIGILLASPILIIGAMVVGPEYGALAALCVGAVRRRAATVVTAGRTLVIGLVAASLAALVATAVFRLVDIAPDHYTLRDHELTAFIAHPDAMAAVVAVLAGIVGMLSLTEGRSSGLIGVLVAATTIPAAANAGVAAAYAEWREVGGAALQLGINLTGLVVAGIVTLAIQSRLTTGRFPAEPVVPVTP